MGDCGISGHYEWQKLQKRIWIYYTGHAGVCVNRRASSLVSKPPNIGTLKIGRTVPGIAKPQHTTLSTNSLSIVCHTAFHIGKRSHIKEEILAKATNLRYMGCQITIGWIPGHRDITGNEHADITAKSGIVIGERVDTGMGRSERKGIIKEHIEEKWRE